LVSHCISQVQDICVKILADNLRYWQEQAEQEQAEQEQAEKEQKDAAEKEQKDAAEKDDLMPTRTASKEGPRNQN
jgi:hypothetical protein